MLENVKTPSIVKKIFILINDERILNLVKYNKKIQNQINIGILNYKLFSGKYIIFESNGTGKEYYIADDYLTFEGEYLNGKRNGKGKEYKFGNFSFEGEYLNGKRNGKGKEYKFGSLIFEGIYKNGKRWNGKGYDNDGNVII